MVRGSEVLTALEDSIKTPELELRIIDAFFFKEGNRNLWIRFLCHSLITSNDIRCGSTTACIGSGMLL